MKKSLLLLVLLVVPCLAQNSSIGAGDTWTIEPNPHPYFCVGAGCSVNVEDPSLEVETLTNSELARLDRARKDVQEAEANLAIIRSDIAIHHGQSKYSNSFGLICGGGTDVNVEIHGKYVFRTKYTRSSCMVLTDSLSTIPVSR